MDQPNSSRDVGPKHNRGEEAPAQPVASPGTDPTNPQNQERTGDWIANEGASDRRNNEPGMTDAERKRRKL